MCDYSLAGIPNRLAVEGEHLITYKFCTNSLGLMSPHELALERAACSRRSVGLWSVLKDLFKSEPIERVVAVCIPPGARLVLQDIPEHIRCSLDVKGEEEVIFTQLTADAYAYRDAVRFENGRELQLQKLSVGQRVTILTLATPEKTEHPEHSHKTHVF